MKLDVNDLSKSVTMTITLTGVRRWTLRMRISVALIGLAAWISPIKIHVIMPGPPTDGGLEIAA